MEAASAVLSQYQTFIDQSPKGADAINENDTIFPRFDENTIVKICKEATTHIEPLGGLINVAAPVVYVGDIHGNLTDLLHIFHIFGMPPKTRYLFLGDYVDRGSHSIEVITILLALVCKFPDAVFLIRGNHEFSSVNRMYGFYEETLNSYGTEDVWQACNAVFGYLPFAAVVNEAVFCVHGGLSAQLSNTGRINDIDLPVGLYEETELISDLVWSDPVDEVKGFEQNKRGSGVLYGPDAVATFLKANKLKCILRGHQCVATGFSFNCQSMVITLFSSSNYCRMLQNKSGVIVHKENRELSFFSLMADSDVGVKPKMTMVLQQGQNLGLKHVDSKAPQGGKAAASGPSTRRIPKPPTGTGTGTNRNGNNKTGIKPSKSMVQKPALTLKVKDPNSSPLVPRTGSESSFSTVAKSKGSPSTASSPLMPGSLGSATPQQQQLKRKRQNSSMTDGQQPKLTISMNTPRRRTNSLAMKS